jgi:hypothetical protein
MSRKVPENPRKKRKLSATRPSPNCAVRVEAFSSAPAKLRKNSVEIEIARALNLP